MNSLSKILRVPTSRVFQTISRGSKCKPSFDPSYELPKSKWQYAISPREYDVFKPKTWAKHKEILPILAIIGFVCVVGPSYWFFYLAQTRGDVNYALKSDGVRFMEDKYDVMRPKPRKMLVFNQEYEALPELHEALKYKKDYRPE